MVPRNLVLFFSASLLATVLTGQHALSQEIKGNSDICAGIITKTEMQKTIPLHLLRAISLVESGKWDKKKGARVAWPWTVMAEGKGRYLHSKEAAINEVRKLKAKGVRNIDVGCMQVNLHHHAKAFSNLEAAFDPQTNVAYAAQFLIDLRKKSPSWTSAVGRYHSYNQEFSTPYRRKVLKAWRDEKHRLNKEMRIAALEKKAIKQAAIKARQPGAISVTHIKVEADPKLIKNVPKSSPRKKNITKNTPADNNITKNVSTPTPTPTQMIIADTPKQSLDNRSIATRLFYTIKKQES
ncbi:transglycosylase SLT domain-containing protein [Kiloniella antarctica]|uniref:Transglycosylase SLT domain-containing protein n=1 Tax=Kiloniella antarctica TaxID=1550907 RepID=A0ABW5BH60_9PROT